MSDAAQHKDQLRSYFDGVGFERWMAIYGQAQLSPIRRSIRDGHAVMVAQATDWLIERLPQDPATLQVLDAGCGPGLVTVALAQRGFSVTAVDIAPQMVDAARQQVEDAGLSHQVRFRVGDAETVGRDPELPPTYDAVVCFDVLIHYPASAFVPFCTSLARLCRGTLLVTYAPRTPLLAALHRLGSYFPKSQRRTEIQMLPDRLVATTLAAAGMQVRRSCRISNGFYHVTLLEATR